MLRDTLKTLLAAYGPTGSENAVAEAVKGLLEGHVDSMHTDHMGNLIVEKFGSDPDGRRVMFSAHMDHIGLVVTNIEKEGFLRVSNVGGISPAYAWRRKVVFEDGTPGVCFVEPNPKDNSQPMLEHLFIDIGAESREEAEKQVRIGDIAVYAPDFIPLGRHRVASPAMDDRCACALLVEMLLYAEDQKNTIVGVFSTQEEVGLRGAGVAAFNIQPDVGLALDVTAWGDTPEVKYPAVKLGQGPAVKIMDRSMIASPLVRDALFSAAEAAGVQVQREVLAYGGTDGGAIQTSRGGVPTGTLSIPCRYVHSAVETIDMRDMEGALKVLLQFIDRV
ncbi:MAG: M20/M25/M40 family metallo-hydrolase [Eubacteriales bacterium]|nr:M20/M25/M40 family metallo-hydrolase [Eubacteriales bacterium]